MLNKLENIVVNPTDCYGRYHSPKVCRAEVNSGQWYQDTYDKVIIGSAKDFFCPIIFAIDKTVISKVSHLSVHVILFTTTIFNCEVCVMQLLLFILLQLLLTCTVYSFLDMQQSHGLASTCLYSGSRSALLKATSW
jgi:hypothetical protein